MKLYLAGKMTGVPQLNFPLFNSEAARLRALGYDIINPAEINGGADELAACATMTPEQLRAHWCNCMRKDIAALVTCDGVAFLPGWQDSRGAQLENFIAVQLDMDVHMAYELQRPLAGAAPAPRSTDWAAA